MKNDKVFIDLRRYEDMDRELAELRKENNELRNEKLLSIRIDVCEWGAYFSNYSDEWLANPTVHYPVKFSYSTPSNLNEEMEKVLSKYGEYPDDVNIKDLLEANKKKRRWWHIF